MAYNYVRGRFPSKVRKSDKVRIIQTARRRFTKPEYIACPGCSRTMYDLQKTLEEVKARTFHLKGMVIAVMGCIGH